MRLVDDALREGNDILRIGGREEQDLACGWQHFLDGDRVYREDREGGFVKM